MHLRLPNRYSILIVALFVAAGLVTSLFSADTPDLKTFLYSTNGTHGWSPAKATVPKDDVNYDFFKDGRLHIQGPDGEATMWQGKWQLKGDKLSIVNNGTGKTRTFKAVIDGQFLLLDGARYRRYAPR